MNVIMFGLRYREFDFLDASTLSSAIANTVRKLMRSRLEDGSVPRTERNSKIGILSLDIDLNCWNVLRIPGSSLTVEC